MTTPVISVVVPALDAAGTIAAQMEALASQDFEHEWEVIVVDNGSTDGTASLAMSCSVHPSCDLRVVREHVRGLNVARNSGIRAARAECVALCDADDVVDRSWLSEMVRELRDCDVVGGGLSFGELNEPATCLLRGWTQGGSPAPSVGRELGFLDQVIGANLAFRRHVWAAVDGFDEAFGRGGDDVDFAWRVQLAGFRICSHPSAVVHYRGRATRRQMFTQYVRDGEGSAHLYALHRINGMPRRGVSTGAASVVRLMLSLVGLPFADPSRQGHIIRKAGKQWGRLRGSVRNRVLYL